jgi:hypothetical protein
MSRGAETPLVLVACALLASCSYSRKYLDRSEGLGGRRLERDAVAVEDVPVKGFRIRVEHRDREGKLLKFWGELLAVDGRSLWVLAGARTRRVERRSLRSVKLEMHPSNAALMGIWSAVGAISTLSHGRYLVISAPVWVVAGTGAVASAWTGNELKVPLDRLDELRQFARFPAGMPAFPR